MRVLVVVHGFPPDAAGGCEIYAHAHASALRALDVDVTVLTREQDREAPEYRVRRETMDGLPVIRINNSFRATRSYDESYRNPAIGAIAARVIDEVRPDIAHVHHLTGLSTTIVQSLAERQVPCVVTLHDYWLMCHRGQLLDRNWQVCTSYNGAICRLCLGPEAHLSGAVLAGAPLARAVARMGPARAALVRRLAVGAASRAAARGEHQAAAHRLAHMRQVTAAVTQFLAPSNDLEQRFCAFGIDADRMCRVEYGVDHRPFRHLRRVDASKLRLGFLGTLMISKAPHLLLEAFRGLPSGTASVDVIGAYSPYHGDDSYGARLAPLLATDGVRVHGAMPHDRVAAALASIDVLVVPSIWPENSPFVVREAFLAGVPVVGAAIGGIPELVTHEQNGLLFRAGDVADLTRTLSRLLDEPDLLPRLRAGIPAVRTIEDDARWTRDLYVSLVGRKAEAATGSMRNTVAQAKRLACVVVNYRTPDDTFLTVRALLTSTRRIDDLIVVNQAASGDTPAMANRLGPGVTCLPTTTNLGFSGGVNVGIRHALARGADLVMLVNSDAIVPPDAVRKLEHALTNTEGTGIAGPAVLSRQDPGQVASLGIGYAPRSGRFRHRAFGEDARTARALAGGTVDAVSGCVMLIRKEVFDAIGLFDEDYFFSFEDLDFCLSARRAGFTVALVADAFVYHEGSRSIGANSPEALYFASRNHLRFGRRADAAGGRLQSIRRTASIVALNTAHAIRSGQGPLPARLRAVARGTRDYFKGRFGNSREDTRD